MTATPEDVKRAAKAVEDEWRRGFADPQASAGEPFFKRIARAALSAMPSAPAASPDDLTRMARAICGATQSCDYPQCSCDDIEPKAHAALRASAKGEAEFRREAWRPIETAPKDGTLIVLHVDWERLSVVGYFGPMKHDPHDSVDNQHTWRVAWDESRIADGYDAPTHWQPLPPPPISPTPSDTGETT